MGFSVDDFYYIQSHTHALNTESGPALRTIITLDISGGALILGKRSVALPSMTIVEKYLLKKAITMGFFVMPIEETSINTLGIYC